MALTKQQAFEEAVRRGLIDRSGKQLRPARPREMTPQTRFKQIDDEIGAEIRDATARQQTALDPLSWQTGLPTVDDVRIGAVRASPEAEAFGRSARRAVDALKGVKLGLPSAEQVRQGVEGFGEGAVQLGESTARGVGQAAESVWRDPLGAARGFGEGAAKAAPAVGSFLGNMAWEMTGVPSMQRYVEGEGVYGQGLELGDKAMAGSGAVQSAVNSPGAFYAVPGIVEGGGLVRDAIGLGAKMLPKMGKKEALKGVGPQFDGNVGREFQPAIRVGGKTYDADMNLLRDLGPAVSISGVEPEVKSIIESALKYARGDRGKAIENLRADMSEWAGADPVLANRYRAALAKLKDQGGPPPAEDLGAEIRAIKAQVDDAVNPDPFSEWIEGGPMASVPPREAMQNTLIGRERLVDEGRKRAGIAPLTMDEIIEAGREEGPRLGRRLEETTGIYGLGGRREGTPMLQTALGAGAGGTLGYLATPKDAEASVGDGDGSTGALATAGLGAILGGALTRGKGARLAVKGLGGKEIPVFKNPTPAQLRTLGAENKGGLKFVLDDNGDRYVFPEFFYHDEVAKGLHDSGAPFKKWDWGGEHGEARGLVETGTGAQLGGANRLERNTPEDGTKALTLGTAHPSFTEELRGLARQGLSRAEIEGRYPKQDKAYMRAVLGRLRKEFPDLEKREPGLRPGAERKPARLTVAQDYERGAHLAPPAGQTPTPDDLVAAWAEWTKIYPRRDIRAGAQGSAGSIRHFAKVMGVSTNTANGALRRRLGNLGGAAGQTGAEGKWSTADRKTTAPSADEVTEGAKRLGIKPERYAALSAKRKSDLAVPAAAATGGITALSALGAPEARAEYAQGRTLKDGRAIEPLNEDLSSGSWDRRTLQPTQVTDADGRTYDAFTYAILMPDGGYRIVVRRNENGVPGEILGQARPEPMAGPGKSTDAIPPLVERREPIAQAPVGEDREPVSEGPNYWPALAAVGGALVGRGLGAKASRRFRLPGDERAWRDPTVGAMLGGATLAGGTAAAQGEENWGDYALGGGMLGVGTNLVAAQSKNFLGLPFDAKKFASDVGEGFGNRVREATELGGPQQVQRARLEDWINQRGDDLATGARAPATHRFNEATGRFEEIPTVRPEPQERGPLSDVELGGGTQATKPTAPKPPKSKAPAYTVASEEAQRLSANGKLTTQGIREAAEALGVTVPEKAKVPEMLSMIRAAMQANPKKAELFRRLYPDPDLRLGLGILGGGAAAGAVSGLSGNARAEQAR